MATTVTTLNLGLFDPTASCEVAVPRTVPGFYLIIY